MFTRHRRVLASLCLGLAALLPSMTTGPASAQQPVLPECTCRANGSNFRVGEQVCLSTPEGQRMAMCELTQNVTNWRFSTAGCSMSSAPSHAIRRLARL